jgi:hypothetical protein
LDRNELTDALLARGRIREIGSFPDVIRRAVN